MRPSSTERLVDQLRFESSLAHLSNALEGQATAANVKAGNDVDTMLARLESVVRQLVSA